jgi:hypothetical protein
MNQEEKIPVINYLDKNVEMKNKKLKKFDITKLQKAFPEIDELTLKLWEKEWRTARQAMVDMKF